jgi:hypothetical protein
MQVNFIVSVDLTSDEKIPSFLRRAAAVTIDGKTETITLGATSPDRKSVYIDVGAIATTDRSRTGPFLPAFLGTIDHELVHAFSDETANSFMRFQMKRRIKDEETMAQRFQMAGAWARAAKPLRSQPPIV